MLEKLKWVYRKEIVADLEYFFLVGAVLLFTVLRLPSLVEPDWYGDEGIYQVIGRALNSGRILYKDIWDNKPPLLYLYYAFADGDLFLARLFSLIFGALAIVVFFLIAKSLFQRRKLAIYFSTFVFAILFGLPLIEGNIANAENFMLLPILLSLFFILKLKAKSGLMIPVLVGLFLSIGFLTKIVAVFDLGAFLIILFMLRFYNKPFKEIVKQVYLRPLSFFTMLRQETIIIISFCVPIAVTFFYFFANGALLDYMRAAFSQNVGYVGYGNHFIIPQGFLILKLLLLLAGVFAILGFKKKLGVAGIVIYTWLIFSLFNAFFSGRPYTHYVLVLLPAFCLLVGFLFSVKKYTVLHIAVAIFLIVFLRSEFNFYTKITPYYQNYLAFVMGEKSVVSYQAFFDQNTPRNYEVANFLKINTKKDESVFLLSDSSTIYYLADKLPPGRYIVEYHISFYKDGLQETKRAVQKAKPKFMVVTKEKLLPEFAGAFTKRYTIQGITIYER